MKCCVLRPEYRELGGQDRGVILTQQALKRWGWDPVGISWNMPWWRRWWLVVTRRAFRFHAVDGSPVVIFKPSDAQERDYYRDRQRRRRATQKPS